jgi:hypothetical protein
VVRIRTILHISKLMSYTVTLFPPVIKTHLTHIISRIANLFLFTNTCNENYPKYVQSIHGNWIHSFHADRKVVITVWNASISDRNFVTSYILQHFMSCTAIRKTKARKDSWLIHYILILTLAR